MKRRCYLLLASLVALATAAAAADQEERRDDVEMVQVIIGVKETDAVTTFSNVKGGHLKSQFKRTNAFTMTIPADELDSLEHDDRYAYVAVDSENVPFAETMSWGIPATQANSPNIPLPDPTGDCFKICIVDSGVNLNHPDIVSLSCASAASLVSSTRFLLIIL